MVILFLKIIFSIPVENWYKSLRWAVISSSFIPYWTRLTDYSGIWTTFGLCTLQRHEYVFRSDVPRNVPSLNSCAQGVLRKSSYYRYIYAPRTGDIKLCRRVPSPIIKTLNPPSFLLHCVICERASRIYSKPFPFQ